MKHTIGHSKDANIIMSDMIADANLSMAEQDRLAKIDKIKNMMETDPLLIPTILDLCGQYFDQYRDKCRKQNDFLMREALGDAVHLLGMKRRPKESFVRNMCSRIEEAIFPKGIVSHHHEGEKRFYKRYIEVEDEHG